MKYQAVQDKFDDSCLLVMNMFYCDCVNTKTIGLLNYRHYHFLLPMQPEMCSECKIDGLILPSIKSFQMRLKLPKVNFIFYEYFFKAVVRDGNW